MGTACPSGDDLVAHALGALDSEEERSIAEHVGWCERCASELRRLGPAVGVLAESVPQHEPPAALRERLLEIVRREAEPVARVRRRPSPAAQLLRPATAVAVLAIAVAGIAGYLVRDQGNGGADTVPVSSELPGASATLEVGDEAATLQVRGMPPLPKAAVYQVWVSEDGELRASSRFVPGQDGTAAAAVPEVLEGARGVLVTREPRPGRRTPSSSPVLNLELD